MSEPNFSRFWQSNQDHPNWYLSLSMVLVVVIFSTFIVGLFNAGATEEANSETAPPPEVSRKWLKERTSDAEDVSRSAAREERIAERKAARKEERRLQRQEARQQARQEARAAERRQERVEARQEAQQAATPAPTSSGGSSQLPSLLLFIRSHESGGNYSAYNASGCEGYGCGGAYQLHARYAPTWAARAGYPGMGSNAASWPASVQDAVALHLFYSTNPDGAHWCNWTSYC